MTRGAIALCLLAGGLVTVGAAVALQVETTLPPPGDGSTAAPPAATPETPEPATVAPVPPAAPRLLAPPLTDRPVTPMGERVAVLGLLNKRSGATRDLTLRPGQSIRVGNAIVRLRACEVTAPWEAQKLTGAFVQLDVRGTEGEWRRAFSGWLFKESPSLNVVEHPIYDVWPKSCAMRYPDIGAATVEAASVGAGRSSAKKSEDVNGEAAPTETPSAESSNPT